jgi:hypothetical protein
MGQGMKEPVDELLAQMGDWDKHINSVLDASAASNQGVEEVHVGELASSVADWCKGASTEAATSLAKKAKSLLPREPPVSLKHMRQRTTGASTRAPPSDDFSHQQGAGGWLSGTISSTVSFLSGSHAKSGNTDRCSSRSGGQRENHGENRRSDGGGEPLRRQHSDIRYDRPKSERPKASSGSEADANVKRPSSMRLKSGRSFLDPPREDGSHQLRRETSAGSAECREDQSTNPQSRSKRLSRDMSERDKVEKDKERSGSASASGGGGGGVFDTHETLQV